MGWSKRLGKGVLLWQVGGDAPNTYMYTFVRFRHTPRKFFLAIPVSVTRGT
jgi:hypothetical protein